MIAYAAAAVGFTVGTILLLAGGAALLGRCEWFTATIDALVECPHCEGRGVVVTGQDFYGNYEDVDCTVCYGRGEQTPELIAEWQLVCEAASA